MDSQPAKNDPTHPRLSPTEDLRSWVRPCGFTLLEVLLVISILALLAGVLFPVMRIAQNQAKHTVCADNLHQLGLAEHLYANDHDGWVPPATTAANGGLVSFDASPEVVAASPGVLRTALAPYVKADGVWFCPTDPQAHKDVLWLGMRHLLTSYWIYPVTDGKLGRQWPPRMQLMGNESESAKGVPLICDATGIPDIDSDPQFRTNDQRALSNHPDQMVNIVRQDLHLERKPASVMMGTQSE